MKLLLLPNPEKDGDGLSFDCWKFLKCLSVIPSVKNISKLQWWVIYFSPLDKSWSDAGRRMEFDTLQL